MPATSATPGGRPKPNLVLVGDQAAEPVTPAAIDELTENLYRAHGSALLRFARKLTLGDNQRAEDIVQETLLRAWRHPEVLGAGINPRPWLFTVARRIAIDMWRTRPDGEEILDSRQIEASDPADPIGQVLTAFDIRRALGTLSGEHRRVIVEMYYRNRSVIETAETLGVPVGTVKSRTYYAIRALRRALRDLGYSREPSRSASDVGQRPSLRQASG